MTTKIKTGKKNTLETNVIAVVKSEHQITTNALDSEDGFIGAYGDRVLEPEINPEVYFSLIEQNNTINQCVSAMEVNIDGTGCEVVRTDGEELQDSDDTEIGFLKQFFGEVYPQISLMTLRRTLRREAETCGYSCMEVIRTAQDEIVFLKDLKSKSVRLVKLEEPVIATKTLMRRGNEVPYTVSIRERVFVQKINNKKIYFKEFGASRDLNKYTGEWSTKGIRLPAQERATEVIYFCINKSSKSNYGVPRWLNQFPSVLGSREAEELNLEFFESGGIPPVMIFVSGGVMGEVAQKNINALLSGKAKDKLRGLVADIQSTGGTIDKAGAVDVKVETFGSENSKDSLFENYDTRCEERVRAAFRLPPLFVGKSNDYSYASVFASYTVAEAQVFNPERMEWDELFNNTIMKELTGGEYSIKSKPLLVSDAETNLKALELATVNKVISKDTLRKELSSVSSVTIPLNSDDGGETVSGGKISADKGIGQGGNLPDVTKSDIYSGSFDDMTYVSHLANLQTKSLLNLITKKEQRELQKAMSELGAGDTNLVGLIVSQKIYSSMDNDPEGMLELCGCVASND